MKLPPIKFNLLGGDFSFKYQNILGGIVILLVLGYQLSNRGGVTQVALPESANQKLINDLQNVSEASGEKAIAETQFSGLVPENVDFNAIYESGKATIEASNALHAGSQLALLSYVKERKEVIVKGINSERNNPKNQACFATEWKDAQCLSYFLQNRKLQWEEAYKTPSYEDDLSVIFEQMAFALVIQEVLAEELGVEPELIKIYEAQLTNGNFVIDSSKAYAGIFNLTNQAQKALEEVQVANKGATTSISGRTQEQYECLNSGVINAETAKKCGVKPE